MTDRRLILYLLDAPQGDPLQFWTFDGTDLIRIGRAPDNDVIVPHPRVSRAHAWISGEGGSWRLGSISEQGVFHQDRKCSELHLEPGLVFRLGPGGPYFRFGSRGQECLTSVSTLNINLTNLTHLALDKDRLMREVREIADAPYFRTLRATAARLRDR